MLGKSESCRRKAKVHPQEKLGAAAEWRNWIDHCSRDSQGSVLGWQSHRPELDSVGFPRGHRQLLPGPQAENTIMPSSLCSRKLVLGHEKGLKTGKQLQGHYICHDER